MPHDDVFLTLDRRAFLGAGLATGAVALMGGEMKGPRAARELALEEATVEGLQAGLAAGHWTSADLVRRYQARIKALDQAGPRLNSVIELNPDALTIAKALDAERKAGKVRGALHGIPVLIKDNIDTADRMKTTAGSLALAEAPAPKADAFVVARLREAGAVILGKTNLSEWANFRSTRSTSGWSGRGGQTRNPFALDRNPSGSSSGSAAAVSASLCAVAVGTETDGSIVSPAGSCGVVGLKPTVGLVGRSGIIPIAHSQDTAGPMTRTVRDAAILLSALAGEDPRDPATRGARGQDYVRLLDPDGLRGARIGVARAFFGRHPGVDRVMARALETLKAAGAVLVDPVDLPTAVAYRDAEFEVLLCEFKADLNAYLAARGGEVKDLAGLIAWNEAHADREMPHFGQELLIQAQAKGPLTDEAYLKALEKGQRLSREGLDRVLDTHRLDAIVAPTRGPAGLTDWVHGGDPGSAGCSAPPAVSGYPHLTVPAGFVYGLPVGLSFLGRAWSEGTLLRLGFAFEKAGGARRAPGFSPSAR